MFLYKVGCESCEESFFLEFQHDQSFTQDEFFNMIKSTLKRVRRLLLNDDGAKKDFFAIMMHPSFKVEFEKLGFTQVQYEQSIWFGPSIGEGKKK